jgi:hypothetical protein
VAQAFITRCKSPSNGPTNPAAFAFCGLLGPTEGPTAILLVVTSCATVTWDIGSQPVTLEAEGSSPFTLVSHFCSLFPFGSGHFFGVMLPRTANAPIEHSKHLSNSIVDRDPLVTQVVCV